MMRGLRWLASLRLTLLGMIALGVCAGIGTYQPGNMAPWIAGPLAILTLNLVAAIVVDARFRNRVPLLGFHLCLLAVVALGGAGQLMRFTGSVELAQGQQFDPSQVRVEEQGAWHYNRLSQIAFEQAEIVVRYGPRLRRVGTESAVLVENTSGEIERYVVGDPGPLLSAGYRLYPTANKGFAAYLVWMAANGEQQFGTVHFPSFPVWDNAQENRWQLPNGPELLLQLNPDVVVSEEQPWVLSRAGSAPRLTVFHKEQSTELQVGEQIVVGNHVVRFQGVGMWMAYWIYAEPTMPWLLAAACLAVILIGWHFAVALRSDKRLESKTQSMARRWHDVRAV